MSEPTAEPSLIQQRLALQRRRTMAIVLLVIWIVSAAWWLGSGLLAENDGLDVLRIIVGGVNLVLADGQIYVLRNVLRDVRSFEARHGADAGRRD